MECSEEGKFYVERRYSRKKAVDAGCKNCRGWNDAVSAKE
jgi:hypothetical protein